MARLIAVFVSASSPGQVFRFLERSFVRAGSLPFPLLLSDAVGPRHYRVLTLAETTSEAATWLEDAAARLAGAFASEEAPVWLLVIHDDGTWSHGRWVSREIPPEVFESSADTAAKPGAFSAFLSRLGKTNASAATCPPAVVLWAQERGLPLSRIPDGTRRGGPRVIDYATVAQLDQKGLLLEDGPRLYRLAF